MFDVWCYLLNSGNEAFYSYVVYLIYSAHWVKLTGPFLLVILVLVSYIIRGCIGCSEVWRTSGCCVLVTWQWSGVCRLECEADQVRSVYMSASTLKMHRATEACSQFLADNLTLHNCLSMLGPVCYFSCFLVIVSCCVIFQLEFYLTNTLYICLSYS